MFRLLKSWLRDKLITEEEWATRVVRQPVLLRGKAVEEKLEFWVELAKTFETPGGRNFMSQMQLELDTLQDLLLVEKDRAVQDELVHRMRQQAYVLSYPARVLKQVGALQKKIQKP